MLTKEEILKTILATLLIGFLIAFTSLDTFTLEKWAISSALALIILIPHIFAHKLLAYKFNCSSEFDLLTLKRYGLASHMTFKKPFPFWLFIPLLIILLTNGLIKLFTIETFNLATNKASRIGRWQTELSEWEIAQIALVGPLTNLIIATISSIAGFHQFAIINTYFAFFSLLPFGNLDGTKIYFGGRITYIFILTLTLIILILLHITNIYISIIAGLLTAIIAAIAYYAKFEQ